MPFGIKPYRFYKGDIIKSPSGLVKVLRADERTFDTYNCRNVPYYEGGNNRTFTLYKRSLINHIKNYLYGY